MMTSEQVVDDFFQQEFIFRWLTVTTVVLFMYVLSFSIQKSGHAKNWRTYFTPTEGLRIAIPIRLAIASQMFGVAMVSGLPVPFMRKLAYFSHCPFLPNSVRYFGFVPFLAGVVLLYFVLRALGKNYSMSCDIKANHKLIDFGPYAHVRHPMYTVLTLCWGSISVISSSYWISISSAVMLLFVMRYRTPVEEQMMRDSFGEEYTQYEQRVTARYIPSFSTFRAKKNN